MSTDSKQRILFVSDHGYLPEQTGGREVSTHELSMQLTNAGHHVAVLARERARTFDRVISLVASMKASPRSLFAPIGRRSHWQPGYRIYRSRNVESAMTDLIARGSFDFAVLQFDSPHRKIDFQASFANRYVVYIRDAEGVHEMDADSFPAHVPLITNSTFAARKLTARTGREVSMLMPYVEKSRYATSGGGRFVTFVNPVPQKGVELAIQIAMSCPEIPFLFVEGWPQARVARHRLAQRIAAIPNITLRRSVIDMRQIYSQTRVLLVPSQWEESWARVVTESHFSGIPVLASDTGGLRESVGRGGILIPISDPVDRWAENLRLLYMRSDLYEELSTRARDQAQAYWMKAQSLPSALLECCGGMTREIR
jgi:glycosyltransferase involved in cell wall biosynthesis